MPFAQNRDPAVPFLRRRTRARGRLPGAATAQSPGGSDFALQAPAAGAGRAQGRCPGAGGARAGPLTHGAESAGPPLLRPLPPPAIGRAQPSPAPLPSRSAGARALPGSQGLRGEPGGGARALPERALPAAAPGLGRTGAAPAGG